MKVVRSMVKRLWFFAGIVCLFAISAADARVWTDKSGRQQIEAEFVDASRSEVWLKPPDAPTFSVRLSELSRADQDYVAELLRRERAERQAASPDDPKAIRYGPGRQIAQLACPALDELSGMACSRRHPGLFWAHNDSGDEPRLYLFDRSGRDLGSCLVAGVRNFDWEDMASFTAGGKPYLLIADTGNNGLSAAVHMIYVVEEPSCDPRRGVTVREVPPVEILYFSFEDDFRNCEAAAIDPTDKTILLVSKERSDTCHIYALAWPKEHRPVDKPPKTASVARLIGTLKLRQVTGMDVSPDGRRAVVVTYNDAFEYTRGEKEDWARAFARPPRWIEVPERAQGEAICYGPDGKTLYLSSERRPTPLIEIPVVEGPRR